MTSAQASTAASPPESGSRRVTLEDLTQHPGVWRGSELARPAAPGIPTGFAILDEQLPGHGWPVGTLTELLPAHEGIGELRLLGKALARIAASGRTLAWIAPPYLPYAPAFAASGIALERVIVVRTRDAQETLWATEQSLRANACGAVLAWLGDITDYAALRRLQLAAEDSTCAAFLFRTPDTSGATSPAALRLELEAASGGLSLRILKRRGKPLQQPIRIPLALDAEFNWKEEYERIDREYHKAQQLRVQGIEPDVDFRVGPRREN